MSDDMRARIAEVADVIRTTPDVCGDPRCPECAAHLASSLLASFVVVPKDQLHQQWGVGIVSDGTIDANANTCATPQAARKLLASLNAIFPDDRRQLVTRWQPGPWRPADSKEQG